MSERYDLTRTAAIRSEAELEQDFESMREKFGEESLAKIKAGYNLSLSLHGQAQEALDQLTADETPAQVVTAFGAAFAVTVVETCEGDVDMVNALLASLAQLIGVMFAGRYPEPEEEEPEQGEAPPKGSLEELIAEVGGVRPE